MKIRMKNNLEIEFYTGEFNTHAVGEIVGAHESFGVDLFFTKDLDVFIEARNSEGIKIGWKDMRQAFRDHEIITDNFNKYIFEPLNDTDKKRGFTLN